MQYNALGTPKFARVIQIKLKIKYYAPVIFVRLFEFFLFI